MPQHSKIAYNEDEAIRIAKREHSKSFPTLEIKVLDTYLKRSGGYCQHGKCDLLVVSMRNNVTVLSVSVAICENCGA